LASSLYAGSTIERLATGVLRARRFTAEVYVRGPPIPPHVW
jgi:hypothetical protein